MKYWVIAKRSSRYYLGLRNGLPDLFKDFLCENVIKFKLKREANHFFTHQFKGDKSMYYILKVESENGQIRQTKTNIKTKRKDKSR